MPYSASSTSSSSMTCQSQGISRLVSSRARRRGLDNDHDRTSKRQCLRYSRCTLDHLTDNLCAEASSTPRYQSTKRDGMCERVGGCRQHAQYESFFLKAAPSCVLHHHYARNACRVYLFIDIQFARSQVCLREDAATKDSRLGSL